MKHFDSAAAPHIKPTRTVQQLMLLVVLALLPGIAAQIWYFGIGVAVQIVLASLFAVLIEAAMLRLRQRPLKQFLSDGSVVVCAVLFALCIPPLAPWWVSLIGMLAAVAMAKHLYGGLGHNLFNPAMVGFALVLIAFPFELSQWLPPRGLNPHALSLTDSLYTIFNGHLPPALDWDSIAQATPLDVLRNQSSAMLTLSEIRSNPVFGDFGGRGWEWIANAYALGGLFLLWKRVIHWQAPLATLASVIALTLPFWLLDADINPFPLQHVFSGALVLAAFFIVTDPVTGCATPRGRLIFGAGVGVITLAIRRWGSYPDGVAFAVLLMNGAAPLIDLYTRPRMYGENASKDRST